MPSALAAGTPVPSRLLSFDTASPASSREPIAFPRWQRVRDGACGALLAGETRLVVTGPAGSGKTMLLQDMARVLRFAGWHVAMPLPGAPADPPPGADITRSVLLIDEADRQPPAELAATLRGWKGPVVLAGLDALASQVPGATRIKLRPLDAAEARAFGEQIVARAGHGPERLDEDAAQRAFELSEGTPRLLATLLGAAIFLADAAGSSTVTRQHVQDAAGFRDCFVDPDSEPAKPTNVAAPARPPRARRRTSRALIASAACCAALVVPLAPLRLTPDALPPAPELPSATASLTQVEPQAPVLPVRAESAVSEPAPISAPEPATAPAPIETAAIAPEPPAPPPPQPQIEPVTAKSVEPAPVETAPAAPEHDALTPELVDLLLRRGHEMLGLGDISAARLLFGRASASGNAAAMMAMGQTYDPAVIAQFAPHLAPDPQVAAQWYRLAVASGSTDAAALLQHLTRQASR